MSASAPLTAAAFVAACLAVTEMVRAQTGIDPLNGMLRPVDAYGNVQANRPERRALDIYQNEVQRQVLSGYLDLNRRIGQRGHGIPFALPGDLLSATVNRYSGAVFLQNAARRPPVMNGVTERERREALGSYGGFRQRHSYYPTGDLATVFARRRELIMATGLNAPVEREMERSGALPGLRWSVSRTPFIPLGAVESGANEHDETAPRVSLYEHLTARVDVSHARAQAEGWAFFRDGVYRRAMRSFETAAMLDPQDYESRIGEIFCYFTIGSIRTAFALLLELDRRDPDLFQHGLNMADRYGAAAAAQEVRLTAGEVAESAEQTPESNALHIFVLWYMDHRDDALRAARTLAARAEERSFVAWPDKMRAALASPAP